MINFDNSGNKEMGPISTTNSNLKICKVGYALNQKKLRKSKRQKADSPSQACSSSVKWQGGGLADIIFGFNNDGQPLEDVQFRQFTTDTKANDNMYHDESCSKDGLGNDDCYDVIIHKLTEDLEKSDDLSSIHKLNRLQAYLKSHPHTVIIDPLESVKKVTSRIRSCENISQIKSTVFECHGIVCRLAQPNYFVVPEMNLIHNSDKFAIAMKQHGITYPIICKSSTACGSVSAHIMVCFFKYSLFY